MNYFPAYILIGAGIGLIAGGLFGAYRANENNYSPSDGWNYWRYAVGYSVAGGAIGALVGWGTGALIAKYDVAAAVSGIIGAAVGAGTSAISHRVSTGSWAGAEKAALDGAVDGFIDGFMTGGIMAGAGMALGALGKTSSGIQIGKTAKQQYGNVNIAYGTPKTKGNTLLSIQNKAGKRMFSLDLDSSHAVHMHLPKIFSKAHIPIGAIGSGIYTGVKQW